LDPAKPLAVTLTASSEVMDALLGTKRRSPRVVPDETKLAITDGASRGFVRPVTFGAVQHLQSPLVLLPFFASHPSFNVALHEPVFFPTHPA
jgi:hypothetical protein